MPLNALKHVPVDHTLPAAQIGPLLATLSSEIVKEIQYCNSEENIKTEMELHIALQDENRERPFFYPDNPSPFSCPECNGVLSALKDADMIRYRCHTGHAYSATACWLPLPKKRKIRSGMQ